MQNYALITMLQFIFGLLTFFIPLVFALRSKDAWAIAGVVVISVFCVVVLAGSNSNMVGDQVLAIMLWVSSLLVALAACYSKSKS